MFLYSRKYKRNFELYWFNIHRLVHYFIDTQFKFRFIQFLHCIANISVTKLEKNYRAV